MRFWGEWFGRSMDNCHTITNVQCNPIDDMLILKFNEGETLTIWNPENIKSDSSEFYIRSAAKIKWEWVSYGQPQVCQNLYFKQYEKKGSTIIVSGGKGTSDYTSKKILEAVGQHAVELC